MDSRVFLNLVLTNAYPIPRRELVARARAILARSGFTQNPQLECSVKQADDPYILGPM